MDDKAPACADCGLSSTDPGWVTIRVSDIVWQLVHHEGAGPGLLCPTCLARRLAAKGLSGCDFWITEGPFRCTPLKDVPRNARNIAFEDASRRLQNYTEKGLKAGRRKVEMVAKVRELMATGFSQSKAFGHVSVAFDVSLNTIKRAYLISQRHPDADSVDHLLADRRGRPNRRDLLSSSLVKRITALLAVAPATSGPAIHRILVAEADEGAVIPSARTVQRLISLIKK